MVAGVTRTTRLQLESLDRSLRGDREMVASLMNEHDRREHNERIGLHVLRVQRRICLAERLRHELREKAVAR